MDIKNLKYFEKALRDWDKLYAHERLRSKSLSISQIEIIEKTIFTTEPKKFPDVLRELLFLAGGFCPFFSTGIQPSKKDTLDINDLLEDQNYNPYFNYLKKRGDTFNCFENRVIWSFNTTYESSDKFYFVYLDEEKSDPFVYSFDGDRLGGDNLTEFISLIEFTEEHLSSFIYKLYAGQMEYHNRPIYDESIFSTYLPSDSELNKSINLQNLYSFICSRNLSGINSFIEQGIDITENHSQVILEAAKVSDLKAIDLFIKHGADLYTQNEKVILIAAEVGDPIFIRDLVAKYKFSQISKNEAVVIACSRGIRTSTIYLIDAGAEINAFNSLGLQIALRNNHFYLAVELVNSLGANKNVNFGFLLLFKEKIEQQVTHSYGKKILFENVEMTRSRNEIINKYNSDLRKFCENSFFIFDKYSIKLNKYENSTGDTSNNGDREKSKKKDKNNIWLKIKKLWS